MISEYLIPIANHLWQTTLFVARLGACFITAEERGQHSLPALDGGIHQVPDPFFSAGGEVGPVRC